MERLMQYVWQHRLWCSEDMVTNDGHRIRVLDPGTLNTDAGPDFFNAKVEIGGQTWVGNIEIHVRASDWHRHGHHTDKAYDNVVLHVVDHDDAQVTRTTGEPIPQVVLRVSPRFSERYAALVGARTQLPCAGRIASLPPLAVTEWLSCLAFERLHAKVARLQELHDLYNGSWEDVCYVLLARTLGFGLNGDALERLARLTPLRLLHKHSDSQLQLEALLLGQAGLLQDEHPGGDPYVQQTQREYAFLANKFSLKPMEREAWKLFRIRPQSFPYRRIALLAHFAHGGFGLLQRIVEADDERALREIFNVELSGYWQSHYTFGKPSAAAPRALSASSVDVVLINLVAPILYARGTATGDHRMADRAVDLLEQLRPEQNSIVATFAAAGVKAHCALDSQALIELRRNYCDTRKCLYCRIGHRLLARDARRQSNLTQR